MNFVRDCRNEILSFDILYFLSIFSIFRCFLFNSFKNLSRSTLLPVHLKNILSINLKRISENVCINGYMNSFSKWPIKMFGCEGVQIVPIAQLFICKLFLQSKTKLFSVSIKAKNVVITFVEAVRLKSFSKDFLTDLILSSFGILMYNNFTSRETRYTLS